MRHILDQATEVVILVACLNLVMGYASAADKFPKHCVPFGSADTIHLTSTLRACSVIGRVSSPHRKVHSEWLFTSGRTKAATLSEPPTAWTKMTSV